MATPSVILAHQKIAEKYTNERRRFIEKVYKDYPPDTWHKFSYSDFRKKYEIGEGSIAKTLNQLKEKGIIMLDERGKAEGGHPSKYFMLIGSIESAKRNILVEFKERPETYLLPTEFQPKSKPIATPKPPANGEEFATQREFNTRLGQDFLVKLYQLINIGEEFPCSYQQMAKLTETPANVVANAMQILQKNGLFSHRSNYRSGNQRSLWTITGNIKQASECYMEARSNRVYTKKRKAAATNPMNDSVALGRALAEKCRNYMRGANLVAKGLEDFKAAGIEVDENAYWASMNIEHDERLASIALVMPYINYLETKCNK